MDVFVTNCHFKFRNPTKTSVFTADDILLINSSTQKCNSFAVCNERFTTNRIQQI